MTRSKPAVLTITVLLAFASGPIRAREGVTTTSARGASLQREADARSADSVRVRGATTDTELGAVSTGELVPTIVYRPPRRGSPVSTVGGGSRGSIALPAPLALAPGHVAHTSAAVAGRRKRRRGGRPHNVANGNRDARHLWPTRA